MRVVVYNVRGFRAGVDRVAEVADELRPDILLLQESGGRRALKRFAREVRMDAAADPRTPLRRRVKIAVLVRSPWRIVSHRLHRFERSRPFYPRGALIAQVGRAGRRLWVVSIHLGLAPVERRRHVEELTDLARGLAGPVLIGGDLNELPGKRAAAWLADRYWDAWDKAGEGDGATFPAADPTARIDFLFASEQVSVRAASTANSGAARTASDHRPVVVDLSIED